MPYRNPRIGPLMDGLLKAPSDATARPTAKESGVTGALLAALRKLSEWDTKQGRDLAARMPDGVSLQQGAVPDWISGPKGVASGLKRAAPFDAAHALEMGKVRAAEAVPHEMPDLLPALAREGERIVSTAIRAGDSIFDGANHGVAYNKAVDAGKEGLILTSLGNMRDGVEGFLTSSGRFVDRAEAADIARKMSQLKDGANDRLVKAEHFASQLGSRK